MSDTYTGHVQDGLIVFEGDAPALPPGTRVRVRIEPIASTEETAPARKTLAERLASVIGRAEGLPEDLADQHDHYLHGQPKR